MFGMACLQTWTVDVACLCRGAFLLTLSSMTTFWLCWVARAPRAAGPPPSLFQMATLSTRPAPLVRGTFLSARNAMQGQCVCTILCQAQQEMCPVCMTAVSHWVLSRHWRTCLQNIQADRSPRVSEVPSISLGICRPDSRRRAGI